MNIGNVAQDSCGEFDSISTLSQHLSHDLSFKEKTATINKDNCEYMDLPKSFNMSSLYSQLHSDTSTLTKDTSILSNLDTLNFPLDGQMLPLNHYIDFATPFQHQSHLTRHSTFHLLRKNSIHQSNVCEDSPDFTNYLSRTYIKQKFSENPFLDCAQSYADEGGSVSNMTYFNNFENKVHSLDDVAEEKLNTIEDAKFWDQLQSQWETLAKHDIDSHSWLINREDNEKEMAYHFTCPKVNGEDCDLMKQGILMLNQGQLSSAVGFFESELQNRCENVDAWLLLGTCHAENEQDELAIAALKRCIQLDKSNLDARLLLSVSYANESKQRHACKMLREWLLINPKFSNLFEEEPIESPDPAYVPSFLNPSLHIDTVSLFHRAMACKTIDCNDKSELLMGLGVLYHLSEEYALSIECFRSALSIQPDNPLLWNKLGATLANSDHCEDAINAYKEALKLYPNYVRCRYNLGISCMNLKSFKEACQHFLIALKLQGQGRGPNTTAWNLWSTLRLALMLGDMPNHFVHVDSRNLDKLLEEFNC